MANTVIALKKSATPTAAPADLANGELAINYADGKLYYKHANGTIVSFSSGTTANSFGTVNANNTLVVADTVEDILTLAPGNNISIIGDAVNDQITIALKDDVVITGSLFMNNRPGAGGSSEGGEMLFANSTSATQSLSGPIVIDIYENRLRFFERDGTNRGVYIEFPAAGATVGTNLLASSGSSTDTIARDWAASAFAKANAALPNTSGATFNGSLTVSSNLSADRVFSTNNGNGENFKIGDDAWIGDTNLADTFRVKGQQNPSRAYILFGDNDGVALGRQGSNNLTYGGNTLWHAGNDGTGSGLDADLLDGQHGSYYGVAADVTAAFNKANSTTYNSNVVISVTDNNNAALRIVQSGNTGLIELSDAVTGNLGQIRKDITLTSWNLSGNSLNILAQDTSVTSIFIGNNGSSLYVIGTSGDRVSQFNLTTPWNVATGSNVGAFSVVTQDTAMHGLYIKPDGTQFYLTGQTADRVFAYSMSTPWNITTASYEGVQNASITLTEASSTGIDFKSDGTKFWLIGTTNDIVYEYTLGTAWNVATATVGNSYSIAAFDATAQEIRLSSDGTKLWLIGTTSDYITEHVLSTPWDISTASYRGKAVFLGTLDTNMFAMHVVEGVNKAYIAGQNSDRVYEFDINETIEIDSKSLSTSGEFRVAGNTVIGRELAVLGASRFGGAAIFDNTLSVTSTTILSALTVSGTATLSALTVSGAVNFTGTTSAFTLGTAITTGNWTAGGTAMTGNIILGQSTVTQNVGIAVGATASNNTKYVQIGTNGQAGSNTVITIGSANSVANVNILQTVNVSGNISGTYIQGDGSLLTNINLAPAYAQINTVYVQANTARDQANAAFSAANTALPNTSGVSFAGALTIPGELTLGANLNLDSTSSTKITDPGANVMTFHTAQTERMRIDPTGNLLIGRTDSTVGQSVKVDVNGAINASAVLVNGTAVGSGGITLTDQSTVTQLQYPLFTTRTSGSASVANVASTKLTYNVATGTLSTTNFNSTSDRNKKENIVKIDDALMILDTLNGVRFTWKDNKLPSVGVIAQDVEKMLPELVGDEKSVNYNGLIAVLIEAIKELKAEIEILKSK